MTRINHPLSTPGAVADRRKKNAAIVIAKVEPPEISGPRHARKINYGMRAYFNSKEAI